MINVSKVLPVILAVSMASSIGVTNPAEAKNKATQFMKYLNPVPEKTYLNKSQDRVIKKKGFKTVDMQGAKPVENKELGLFALVPLDKIGDKTLIDSLLKKPDVNGISVLLPWRMLEPVEGETNFKPIDSLLAQCKENNKTLILRVSTSGGDLSAKSDTPDWVFEDSTVRSVVYTGTDGKEHQMPIFWDPNYLAKWSNLINELGEQYDKNQSIHSIGITGGGVGAGTNVIPEGIASIKATIGADIKAPPDKPAKEGVASDTKDGAKADDSSATKDDGSDKKASDEGSEKSTKKSEKTAKAQSAPDDAQDDKSSGKDARKEITQVLEKKFGMTQRQLVEHWKYVADLFPKAFETTRLNFDISPPTPNRKGQDSLDEISDYLVYRYGQRVYLTRLNVKDGKHGFDDYRVLLKFHPDTLTGYRLRDDFNTKEVDKLSKNAAEDGISFCEVPASVISQEEAAVKTAFDDMRLHMGYQLVSKEVSIPKDLKIGTPLKASFTFFNLGAASALKPSRQLDKDVASSYKVQLELRNESGKPIARLLHTPEIPTNQWGAGKPIAWQEELKTPPQLTPGKYEVYLSLVDSDTKRKLRFLHASGSGEPQAFFDAPVGSIQIIN